MLARLLPNRIFVLCGKCCLDVAARHFTIPSRHFGCRLRRLIPRSIAAVTRNYLTLLDSVNYFGICIIKSYPRNRRRGLARCLCPFGVFATHISPRRGSPSFSTTLLRGYFYKGAGKKTGYPLKRVLSFLQNGDRAVPAGYDRAAVPYGAVFPYDGCLAALVKRSEQV